MTNEEFILQKRNCRGWINGDIANLVAENCVKHMRADYTKAFVAAEAAAMLKDNQLEDYICRAIELAKQEKCQLLVNTFEKMFKDFNL